MTRDKKIIEIKGIADHLASMKGVICDLWGVVHNGTAVFPEALKALKSLKEIDLPVILLSNSPRPSPSVKGQLQGIGLPGEYFNALVTSGDLARAFVISEGRDKVFFHLGPKRDRPTTEGLPNSETDDLRSADLILCTGFFEDWSMNPASYEALFAAGIQEKVPMVCANSDKEVDIGGKRFLCAGTLATLYETMGGKVHWFGKPHPGAYEKCFEAFGELLSRKPKPGEILGIGDNLETDIIGGINQGMKTLFIADGLHGHHGTTVAALWPFMKKLDIFPDMVMKRLKW